MDAKRTQVLNHLHVAVHSSKVSSYPCKTPSFLAQSVEQGDVPLRCRAIRHPVTHRHAGNQRGSDPIVPDTIVSLCAEYVHHVLLQPAAVLALAPSVQSDAHGCLGTRNKANKQANKQTNNARSEL